MRLRWSNGACSQPPAERGGLQSAGGTSEVRVHLPMAEPPEEAAASCRQGEFDVSKAPAIVCSRHKCLFLTAQANIKQNQRRLADQLSDVLIGSPGPPTRWLLAHCLALLYRMGDPVPSSLLVERCNDIIRSRDDSPSGLPTRL